MTSQRFAGLCNCGDHAWSVLTRGFITMVSPEDAELLASRDWHPIKPRHVVYARSGAEYLHRAIAKPAPGLDVDHVKGNGLDNRRPMLEVKTPLANAQSHRRKSARNSSGFPGVYFKPNNTRKWGAAIGVNGRQVWLGSYDTPEAAHAAFITAKEQYHGR